MRAQRSRGARRLGALVFGLTLGSFIVLTAIPASADSPVTACTTR